jgi:hypothetical protein
MPTAHTFGGRHPATVRGTSTSDTGTSAPMALSADMRRLGISAGAGIAAGIALTAYLRRPGRSAGVATARRQALLTYLGDHLRGADTAIDVVERLARTHAGSRDGRLFRQLADEFEDERAVVRSLIAHLGPLSRTRSRAAGSATGALLNMTAGGEPGDLSLLLTLEALAIGIQGKRCMWRALQELGDPPSLGTHTFAALETRAVRQWEAVDDRRRMLAAMTFPALGQRGDSRQTRGDRLDRPDDRSRPADSRL